MRTPHDRVLNLRVPASLRDQLDAAAQANPRGLSETARRALAAGLAIIVSGAPDRDPPPAGPAAAMRAAA